MPPTVRFDCYEVDLPAGQLYKHGIKISLRDKSFQVLVALLDHPGEVVTRENLRQQLWRQEVFVDFDNNLNTAIARLREALGDSAEHPRYVETLPKRGYRFIGAVAGPAALETAPLLRPPEPPVTTPETLPRWRYRRHVVLFGAGLAVLFVLVLALKVGTIRDLSRKLISARTTPTRIQSLAVLPFENLTGSEKQEYLSDGLTEEIITEVARMDPTRLGVIARTSVMKFKANRPDVGEIGRQLGVDYVLEGAVRSGAQRVGITVQLIRVRGQTHLWAQEYELNPDDPLVWERNVAERTADALSMELLPTTQKRHAAMRALKPEAHEAYLRGRYLLANRNYTTFKEALQYFNKAVEVEPEYADAYGGLADAYLMMGAYQVLSKAEAVAKAKDAALKALALDDSLTEPRRTLAAIRWEYDLDIPGAGKDFRSAIEANANDSGTHEWYSAYLSSIGEFDEAIAEIKKAAQLDPLSLNVNVDLGRAYYFARQYDLAIAQFRKTLELDTNFARTHSQLGLALLEKGQYDEALAELRISAGGQGSIWLGYACARAGKIAEAKEQLAFHLDFWKKWHNNAAAIASIYVGLGDKDQAFAWLEKDLENHGTVYMIKAWPYWDPLRSDPRYQELLRRIGLPP